MANKLIKSEVSIFPRCPSCGGQLYIIDSPRRFICIIGERDYKIECDNKTQYIIPTVELEVYNG